MKMPILFFSILFFTYTSSIAQQVPSMEKEKIVDSNPVLDANKFSNWITIQPFPALENNGTSLYDYALKQKEIKLGIDKAYAEGFQESMEKMPAMQNEFDNVMGDYEAKMMELYTKGLSRTEEMTEEESEQIDKLIEEQKNRFSEMLTRQMREGPILNPMHRSGKQYVESASINWKQVQATLNDDEAAIEFLHSRYHLGRWKENDLYIALIIRRGYQEPKIVRIGEDKLVERLVLQQKSDLFARNKTRGGISIRTKNTNPEDLYNLIWAELDKLLIGVQKVYYAPSGILHQLSFNALTGKDNQFLTDKYKLHQLATTRSLLEEIPSILPPKDKCWMMLGDISYHDYPNTPSLSSAGNTCNLNFTVNNHKEELPPSTILSALPGTKAEMDVISRQLDEKKINYQGFTASNAPEELMKALGNKLTAPGVLHIGTHGFYRNRLEAGNDKRENQNGYRVAPPLTRSGLYLSGASKLLHSKSPFQKREDGLWSAAEIQKQNLKNTQLLVLSTCNSGLGDIQLREGVFGLQRAFKFAGVGKMLVSLWEVDDAGTAVYMEKFYKNWLSEMTVYQAYRKTQLDMQQHERYNTPYYWAAFVLLE